jgi:hypothetical protein
MAATSMIMASLKYSFFFLRHAAVSAPPAFERAQRAFSFRNLGIFVVLRQLPAKNSGQARRISARPATARDYMAFNWHIPFHTSRRLHPAGEVMIGRIAYGIAVLPFMAETSR